MKTVLDATPRLLAPEPICSIYHNQTEQLACLIPYLRAGIERGERCLYLAENEHKFSPILNALTAAGVDAGAAVKNGALTLATELWATFRESSLDHAAILSLWKEQKASALRAGYSGLRAAIEMDWVLRSGPASENGMGFERLLSTVLAETGCSALSQYDLRACTPAVILGVIRCYPVVVSNAMACENFYFVPPEDYNIPDFNGPEVERRLHNLREREQAVRDLRLFRTLIDRSKDSIEVVDPDTLHFLDVNEQACVGLGYTREELLNLSVFDVNPRMTVALIERILAELRKTGSATIESVHRRKDGSTFPVEVNLRQVQLDRSYIVNITRDMTERKHMEAALREREDHYRDLVEHSSDLICTHDLDGRLLSVNNAASRVLGYSREELLNMSMRDLIPHDGRHQFDDYIARIHRHGVAEGLLVVLTKSAERRVWEYHNTLRTEGVAKPLVRSIAHDVTEQTRAQGALRASEEKFSKAFRASPEMMLILSLKAGRFLEVNEAFERQLGYKREDIIGRTDRQLNLWLNARQRKELLRQIAAKGRIRNQQVQFRTSSGELRTVLVSTETIDLEGQLCLLAVGQDITALKHAESQLRQFWNHLISLQEEERRRIARELHDSTAQELAGIRMNLGIIKRAATRLHPKALQAIAECQQSAEHCAREIRTLSYLLHPPLLDEFGLVMALRGYIEGFGQRSGLSVKLDADPHLELTRFPSELETGLFRIVQESLTNIKQHSGSPTATVCLKQLENEIFLSIRDQGHGISAAASKAIEKGGASSLGVGLPGMRERVRQLGGVFQLETGENGTSVMVAFPLNGPWAGTAHPELAAHQLK